MVCVFVCTCVHAYGCEYMKSMSMNQDAEAVVHAKVDANELQQYRACSIFIFFKSTSPWYYLFAAQATGYLVCQFI